MERIVPSDWSDFSDRLRRSLEGEVLLSYMRRRRWFREKSQRTATASILRISSIGEHLERIHLLVVTVGIDGAEAARYFLPLACARGEDAGRIEEEFPRRIVTASECDDQRCVLYDGVYSDLFRRRFLAIVLSGERLPVDLGGLASHRSRWIDGTEASREYPSRVSQVEQSNTSVVYGERFFLKLFRKIEPGINPDIELTRYLGDVAGYTHVPRYAASLTWEQDGSSSALGLLASYVPDARDGWSWVRDQVDRYFDAMLRDRAYEGTPVLDRVELIGRRTGELHLALADLPPEPYEEGPVPDEDEWVRRTALEQLLSMTMERIRHRLEREDDIARREPLEEALALEEPVLRRVRELTRRPFRGRRIRIHGDYHLGQLLLTDDDLIIIDLEGEPARSPEDRRRRDSVFRDVAGMMRSFHYALSDRFLSRRTERPREAPLLEPLLPDWYRRTSSVFLEAYRRTVAGSDLVPDDDGEALPAVYILEKAIYELGYELDNRPDWISIPIAGIRFVLEQ